MAKVIITLDYLEDIADAIREKTGLSDTYKPSEMAPAIMTISGGGGIVPSGTTSITSNGTYNVSTYAVADVDVDNSYAASDLGKVVSNGTLVSQSAATYTLNSTYDTTLVNSVTVDVESGGGSGGSVLVIDTPNSAGGITREITATNIINLQAEKEVNIVSSPQTITPDSGYDGFESVVVNTLDDQIYDVMFYDYDGTALYGYTKEEFAQLSSFPSNPSHEGLLAQGWNWDLVSAKAYVASYGMLDIGQIYKTDDGSTRFYITIDNDENTLENDIPFKIAFATSVAENTTIDWGDGTSETSANNTSFTTYEHTYSNNGNYIVKLTTVSGQLHKFIGCVHGDLYKDYVNAERFKKIEIGERAGWNSNWDNFERLINLESFILPQGIVQTVGRGAFCHCYKLKHLNIPNGITSFGDGSGGGNEILGSCNSLKTISLPSTITSLSNNTFRNCVSLKRFTFSPNITSIPNSFFSGCSALESVIIPSGVTKIGNNAFNSCRSLKNVYLPINLLTIDSSAFQYCEQLKTLDIKSGLTTINSLAFDSCYSLEEINLPSTVEKVDAKAFSNCFNLRKITGFTSNITTFGTSIFSNCYSLRNIEIPSTMTALTSNGYQSGTFSWCRSLATIVIPNTVTSIGDYTFFQMQADFYFKSTTPPTMSNVNAFNNTTGIIYVPYSSDHSVLNAYKTATNWSTYASRIQEESQ